MSNVHIIVGSVSGTAEFASEALEKALKSHGHKVHLAFDAAVMAWGVLLTNQALEQAA